MVWHLVSTLEVGACHDLHVQAGVFGFKEEGVIPNLIDFVLAHHRGEHLLDLGVGYPLVSFKTRQPVTIRYTG